MRRNVVDFKFFECTKLVERWVECCCCCFFMLIDRMHGSTLVQRRKYVWAQVMCARCEIPSKTFLDTEKTSDAFDDFSFLFIFSFYFWNANESIIESVFMKTLLFLEYVWWRDSVVGRRRHELTSLWWRFWSVVATSSLLDLSSQCEERKKIEIHFDFNLKFLSLWARSSPGEFQNTNEQVCTHETKLIQINATIVNDDRFVMENIFS